MNKVRNRKSTVVLSCLALAAGLIGYTGFGTIPSASAFTPVVNAGFETYTGTNGVADGWTVNVPTTATGGLQVVDSPVKEGLHAQRVSVGGLLTGETAGVEQTVDVDPSSQYELSGYFNIESLVHANVQLYIEYQDAAGTVVDSNTIQQVQLTNGYVRFQNIRIADSTVVKAKIAVRLAATADDASGTCTVDQLAFAKTGDTLVNAGFEDYNGMYGVSDIWRVGVNAGSQGSYSVLNSPVYTGYRAQKIAATNLLYPGFVHMHQVVTAVPGRTYAASGMFNIPQLTNSKFQLYLLFMDKDNKLIETEEPFVQTDPTSGYQWMKTGVFAAPADAAFVQVDALIRANGDGASGMFYADDMRITLDQPVPVPDQPIVDLIPKMTSNTQPLGEVTATPVAATTYQSFDDNNTTAITQPASSGTLGFDFKTPAVVREYSIASNSATKSPKDWKFEGYDGYRWVTLDEQSDIKDWKSSVLTKKFSIPNKLPYLQYRINVTANNGDASSLVTAELAMYGYFGIPATPKGLANTVNTDKSVTLKWSSQLGVTGYYVYQDNNPTPVLTVAAGTTTATLTGLENNRVYHYKISAYNAVGESVKTNEVLAMPYEVNQWLNPTMTSNTVPSGIVTTSVAPANGFKLFDHNANGTSWAGADSNPVTIDYDFQTPTIVKEYALYTYAGAYSTSAPKNWTFEGFDGTQWVVLDTQSNVSDWATYTTKYFTTTNTKPYFKYRLNMKDNNGSLVNGVPNYQLYEVQLLGSYDVPAMPTGLIDTANSDGTVSLKWTPQLGITSYNIYQDYQDETSVPVKTVPVGTTTATLIGLENNRVYRYRISAVNAVGESAKTADIIAMPYSATQWVNPTMTSNTAPSGIVTTSVAPANGFKLFDHNGNGTSWAGADTNPVTIDYDFQTPTIVKEYTLYTYAGAYSTSAPKNWTFEGFDGTQWVVLDTQSNVSDWATYTTKYFTTTNTKPYLKYRLNMTDNNGALTSGVPNYQLFEVVLLGSYDVPAMPTGLIDTANGDGTVSLKWTPQLGITGYNIYQDYQDETSVPVKTIPVGTTTATLTGLENNRVYRYRISAVNAVGESAKTADIIAMPYSATQWVNPTMTSNTAPSGIVTTSVAPANGFKLFDHNGNGTSWAGADTKPVTIDYDFQTPTIVKEYTLYTYAGAYSTSAPKNWTFEGFDGSKWVVLDTQSNVSDWATYTTKYFTTTNTTPYNKYRLNMTDNNGNLVNNVPNYQLFEVVLLGSYDIPAMPTGLMNTSNGDGTVSLKWTPQLGITNYNIYQDDGSVPVMTVPVGTTTAKLIGLENNRVYHYRISAVNAVAESSKSSEVIAMPYNATQWVNPTMTSNTAPSGIVTTSVAPTNGYKLFDHNGNGTNWIGSAATPVTIDYDFQTPTVVKEYTLFTYAGAYSTSAPKDWTFEGFDGTQWVVLDTQTNVTDWATYVTKYFTTSNTTPYTKYRLNMTANNGNANFQLYEVQLLGNH